ncbi:MAG: hypothetical protein J5598_02480, partial [Clostridia bacterium]|nr:hypothetical protein [Clostridia bacterium]
SINNQHYKDILAVYFSVTEEHIAGFNQALNQAYQETIDGKLQEMIDKAPALTKDPRLLRDFAPYKNHYGNLAENTEEVLALFEDTKEITKDKINALGLDRNFTQYFSNTAARASLAQKKLDALAAAFKAKGLIDKNQSTENFSVVDPAEKHSPVNKYVNAVKNVLVNYAKPQNLAKLGFIQIGTKAVQHFVEGAIPGIGAALGLAWKLGECAKKIHKDKQKASDVFKQALPDLTRGVVTVGASFIPVVGVVAGTIGSVASVAMKGIQAAHEEGLTFGHGFMKRIGQEFTKKGNLLNMGAAALGSMVAIEERKIGFIRSFMDKTGVTKLINNGKQGLGTLLDKIRGRGGVEQSASMENGLTMKETAKIEDAGVTDTEDPALQDDEVFGPKLPTDDRISDKSILYDPEGNPISADSEAANDEFYIGEDGGIHVRGATQTMGTEQSYASQVLHNNEGAFVDKNGWVAVRRDDGSVFYPKNDKGQLIALDQEKDKDLLSLLGLKKSVTRNLTENEMLDKAGNIVNKPIEQNNNTFENGQNVEGSFNNAGYEHNTTMHNGKDVYNMYKMEAGNEVRHIIDRNHNGIVDKGDEYITIQREKIGNEEVTVRARGTIGEKNESQTIYTKTYNEQGELQDTLKSYRTGT